MEEGWKVLSHKDKKHRKERAEQERFSWVWRVESKRRGGERQAE